MTVQDDAAPVLGRTRIEGGGEAGIRVLDRAHPRIEDSVVRGNRVGISLEAPGHGRGLPVLVRTDVSDNRDLDFEGLRRLTLLP